MEPINKKSFKSLTKTEQVVLVLKSGRELLSRDDEKFDVHLYLLKNLFVELIYDHGNSTILKIDTPSNDKIIQNYHLDKTQLNQYLNDLT